jgi:HEAT repeat protein
MPASAPVRFTRGYVMPLLRPPKLERLEAKGNVKGLGRELRKPERRTVAQEALIRIGAPAITTLRYALYDNDADVREAAAEALVRIGTPAAEHLIRAPGYSSADLLREGIANVLVGIGAPAVEPLIRVFAELRYETFEGYSNERRDAAANLLVRIGAPAVGPLIRALHDSSADVRVAAANALVRIGDARAVEPLARALTDSNAGVRVTAAWALDRLNYRGAALSDYYRAHTHYTTYECLHCDGTGFVTYPPGQVSYTIDSDDTCYACGGIGTITREDFSDTS